MDRGMNRLPDLLDDDGENRAVRTFLMRYGTRHPTASGMAAHMKESGFDVVPDWVDQAPGHLTKRGAQAWLRMLFALECRNETELFTRAQLDAEVAAERERWNRYIKVFAVELMAGLVLKDENESQTHP